MGAVSPKDPAESDEHDDHEDDRCHSSSQVGLLWAPGDVDAGGMFERFDLQLNLRAEMLCFEEQDGSRNNAKFCGFARQSRFLYAPSMHGGTS
jgi:hypothetical protein